MAKKLDVYFRDQCIGLLEQDQHGDVNFSYSKSWLDHPNAIAISCSLPLVSKTFTRNECSAFFEGLLPEDYQRKLIAKNLGISAQNDFSMLEKIGGECAGALSFIRFGETLASQDHEYLEIKNNSLAGLLRELPARPLLAGKTGIRISQAGVQDKLAVYVDGSKISIPLDSAPSSHILKPDLGHYSGIVLNEAFCLNLAKKIGLSTAEAELRKTEDIDYLLIKRYDRMTHDSGVIERLHQEDFCQALGISSRNKYQNEGGPSFKQAFELLRRISSSPVIDLRKLLNAAIFNFLIGNCDAHGKNFSLLYKNEIELAPLYDLVCTYYYENLDRKMAMKLGGEYKITEVTIRNFDKLSSEAGLATPEVRKSVQALIDIILSTIPHMDKQHRIQEEVADLIKKRCEDFAKLKI